MIAHEIRVVGAARLGHGEAREFLFERGGELVRGFVLYVETPEFTGHVAYRNLCAHVGVDLDMGEGTFWSHKVGRIYCKMHGARYVAHTGVCDFGPCLGSTLERYDLRLDGDDAIVTVA